MATTKGGRDGESDSMSEPDPEVTTYADARARAAINNAAKQAMRDRIAAQEGGLEGFRQTIRIEHIGDPGAGDLQEFHAVLRHSILPSELVPLDDFVTALGPKNEDRAFLEAIGPYRYFGLALRSPAEETIGAAGFAVFCHRQGPATLHASYYALLPRFRGLGLVRLMLAEVARTAVRFVAEARPGAFDSGPVVQFLEANGIADMTLEDRLLDEAIAMHPVARDAAWERLGFREIMNIEYRQRGIPPISLVLKAVLIDAEMVDGRHCFRAFRAPDCIDGDVVLRHISAFDNLLMNYDEASQALASGRPLPDLDGTGLVAKLPPGIVLPVKPLNTAARDRQDWTATDDLLSSRTGLSLEKTMQALRDELDAPSNPASAHSIEPGNGRNAG
jgi:GNAT superfamily N-acetyltransferase